MSNENEPRDIEPRSPAGSEESRPEESDANIGQERGKSDTPSPPEVLERLPKQQRQQIEQFLAASVTTMGSMGN